MKTCTYCIITKSVTEFYKRGDRDAYRSHCKECCDKAGVMSKELNQKKTNKVLDV